MKSDGKSAYEVLKNTTYKWGWTVFQTHITLYEWSRTKLALWMKSDWACFTN